MDPSAGTYEFSDADGVIPRRLSQIGCEAHTANDTIAAAGDVLQLVGGLAPRDHATHAAFAVAVGTLLGRMAQVRGSSS